MSKASEWAKHFQASREEFNAVQMKRPEGAWLKFGPGRVLNASVSEDGLAVLESPLLLAEKVAPSDLCDFAREILRTFEDGPHER